MEELIEKKMLLQPEPPGGPYVALGKARRKPYAPRKFTDPSQPIVAGTRAYEGLRRARILCLQKLHKSLVENKLKEAELLSVIMGNIQKALTQLKPPKTGKGRPSSGAGHFIGDDE